MVGKSSAYFYFMIGLGACLFAAPVFAATEMYDVRSTCTTRNCLSRIIYGDVFNKTSGHVGHKPWVGQVYTRGNECLRVEVIAQTTDLEAILTCAGGATWRDDDGGVGARPLIKAITPGGRPGWCTLTIGDFAGRNLAGSFIVRWGRYPRSNPNCRPPTAPRFITRAPATVKDAK